MRPERVLVFLIFIILITLACGSVNTSQPASTHTPTPAGTLAVTQLPTRTATSTPLPVFPKAEPIPPWVTGFADPIIVAVTGRKPDFQDDFAMNRGWRNTMTGVIWPLYAERQDGMLFLKLPKEKKESILYNTRINRTNFVLTLDLRFDHDQPDDTVRFQFDQSSGQSVAFDFANNRNWKFQWGVQENWQSVGGVYEHFPPERIPVTIIMRGAQCAVYLNDDPLVYSDKCGTSPTFPSSKWAASFRLIRSTRHVVSVNFDNLKLWDLDNMPALP